MKDNLYILKTYGANGSVLYKFGYSNNMGDRMESYKSHNPFIELVGTYYNEDGIKFERLVHSSIQADFGNEWYSVDKLETILDYIHNGVPENVIKVSQELKASREFTGRLKAYCEYKDAGNDVMILFIEGNTQEVAKYYQSCGSAKCRALSYQKSKLDKFLANDGKAKKEKKVDEKSFMKLIGTKGFISSKDIKEITGCKASDVEKCNFLEVEAVSKRIDGKLTKGYNIK